MPSLRFRAHFKSQEPSGKDKGKGKEKETAKDDVDDGLVHKPTTGEYVGEAGRGFLLILEAVADEIPVPGVGVVVRLAVGIIKGCEGSYATLECAEELKLHAKTLAAALVDAVKGMKAEDVQEKLKADIASLERDLRYVQQTLDEIVSQHALLLLLFRNLNDDKVRKCMDRLKNSLERFHLSRDIDHASTLDQLEKQILAFHSRQETSIGQIQDAVDDVKAILDERLPLPSSSSSKPRLVRALVPSNSEIFHGRDALVAKFVQLFTRVVPEGQKRPWACILGPGGMGKTSTALAVMAHPELKKCFPVENQVWVPCVKATSVALFFDTLYSALGITHSSGNARNDILQELRRGNGDADADANPTPLVLLLDNFETPWNVGGGRAEVAQVLRDIHQIPHVAVLLTMRAALPPCEGLPWYHMDLAAVDARSAHRIYSAIYPGGGTDPGLPGLLAMVGQMPLAITLMAKVGKLTGLTAEKLVREYKRVGTAMLGRGSDAEHSMDVCIGLSVESAPMKQHPEAMELLAAVAMLPGGTTYEMLAGWWARDLGNLMGALEVLRETSLLEKRNKTFFVLPVIRRYILDPSCFPGKVRTAMIESACQFLNHHGKSRPGNDPAFVQHAVALHGEEGNLQAVLLQTTAPTPRLIASLILLAQYQCSTRPRTLVIQHALRLVQGMESNCVLLARVLFHYGNIALRLCSYKAAKAYFTRARSMFLEIPDMKHAAECLVHLFHIMRRTDDLGGPGATGKFQAPLLWKAQAEFEAIGNKYGVALCFIHLGTVQQSFGRWDMAMDLLFRAREMFAELGDQVVLTYCALKIANLYYWNQNFRQAEIWAARSQSASFGQHLYLMRTQLLARLCLIRGHYERALRMLRRLYESSKAFGLPLETANAMEQMGRTLAKMGKKTDAEKAFKACLAMYGALPEGGEGDVTRCRYFLKRLKDPRVVPTAAERKSLVEMYPEDVDDLL
ncbi:hypothetical protein D9615_007576 [Tricholomella constricta]|uniref:Novel STAND NTPase 1 domain-containing protein n=1 Tax=Tricholomella constricta TaxID=117010 RepID=A0A8H5M256_9AGAR|nr:hypothetical protein D9615_007576 [Tricholomella constricta]